MHFICTIWKSLKTNKSIKAKSKRSKVKNFLKRGLSRWPVHSIGVNFLLNSAKRINQNQRKINYPSERLNLTSRQHSYRILWESRLKGSINYKQFYNLWSKNLKKHKYLNLKNLRVKNKAKIWIKKRSDRKLQRIKKFRKKILFHLVPPLNSVCLSHWKI